ncbi:MAG: hypothetical protein PVH59_07485 [Anaerolineae bacterium]|jgi:hypothetical protein
MEVLEKVASSTNGERELAISRLTGIDGIAQKTAEAMYEIGIHGYADLDRYVSQRTAQQISAALKEHGVHRPPAFIDQETWVRQARSLGELEDVAPTEDVAQTTDADKSNSSRAEQEHDAEFSVSFDLTTDGDHGRVLVTTVRDATNGRPEQVFRGADATPWVRWMLEQSELPSDLQELAMPVAEGRQPSSTEPESAGARLEIDCVQLSAPGTAATRGTWLNASVTFRLSGPGAEMLAQRGIPFRMEGYTVDLENGASERVVSERSRLVSHVFEYTGNQRFTMPQVGRYDFYSVVLLLPPGEAAAYRRGPRIRIVPKPAQGGDRRRG